MNYQMCEKPHRLGRGWIAQTTQFNTNQFIIQSNKSIINTSNQHNVYCH